jgi:hypothetical protein
MVLASPQFVDNRFIRLLNFVISAHLEPPFAMLLHVS